MKSGGRVISNCANVLPFETFEYVLQLNANRNYFKHANKLQTSTHVVVEVLNTDLGREVHE